MCDRIDVAGLHLFSQEIFVKHADMPLELESTARGTQRRVQDGTIRQRIEECRTNSESEYRRGVQNVIDSTARNVKVQAQSVAV